MTHSLIPFRIFRVTVFIAKRGFCALKPFFRNDETESWKSHMISLGHPFCGGAKMVSLTPSLVLPLLYLLR